MSRQKVALNKSVGQLPSVPVRALGHLHLRSRSIVTLQKLGVGFVSDSGSEQECRTLVLVLFVFFLGVPGGPVQL